MGNLSSQFGSVRADLQTMPEGVVIIADPAHIAALRMTGRAPLLADAVIFDVPSDEPVESVHIDTAPVVVIEVDPESEASLARVMTLRQRHRDLPIIAALARADIASTRMLVRNGINDVAQLPFDPEDLATQVMDLAAEKAIEPNRVMPCPMVAVIRSAGGCGATTFATQLAAEIGQMGGLRGETCFLDLDLQGGDATTFLGCESAVTVGDLLEAGDRIDADFLRSAIIDTSQGFSIIAAPEAIMPLDEVNVDQVLRIVAQLRKMFGCVVLDLPAAWTDWALTLTLSATDILMVTDMSISSLRQARRRLSLLSSVGADLDRVRIVANRAEKRLFKTIGADEVEKALGREVIGTLANEGQDLRIAQDQGMLLSQADSRSRYVKEVHAIASHLVTEWQ